MPETVLDPSALEGYIPHRGVNLIPDEVVMAEDRMSAVSRTTIVPGDSRGRDVMGRQGLDGKLYWNEPFLAELLALTGVPLLTDKLGGDNAVAVFSTISKLSQQRPLLMERELVGVAQITRERSGFFQFTSRLETDGEVVYRGEIMAGSSTLADITAGAANPGTLPKASALPTWDWKQASMRFVDSVVEWDAESGRILCGYTYPNDHPFVPGHFPGAPLMMGVSQWAAVGDAATEAAGRLGLADGHYPVQGRIYRPDDGEVVGVRNLDLAIDGGRPWVAGVGRLAFRDIVRPGDNVLVEAVVPTGG